MIINLCWLLLEQTNKGTRVFLVSWRGSYRTLTVDKTFFAASKNEGLQSRLIWRLWMVLWALDRIAGRVSEHKRTALLGPQDGQNHGCDTKANIRKGRGGAADFFYPLVHVRML